VTDKLAETLFESKIAALAAAALAAAALAANNLIVDNDIVRRPESPSNSAQTTGPAQAAAEEEA